MRQININACCVRDILGMNSIREIVKALTTHGMRTFAAARHLFVRLAAGAPVYAPVAVCVDRRVVAGPQRRLKRESLGLLRLGLWRSAGEGSGSSGEY